MFPIIRDKEVVEMWILNAIINLNKSSLLFSQEYPTWEKVQKPQ